MLRFRLVFSLLAFALAAFPADFPDPPKSDMPYLLMASNLVPTEHFTATKETKNAGRKNEENTYWVPGEHSTAKTPLASPIFVIKQNNLALETLQIFALTATNGRRSIVFAKSKQQTPFTMTVTKIRGTVYRMEVDQDLPAGEYAISPNGSDDVFCFAVF